MITAAEHRREVIEGPRTETVAEVVTPASGHGVEPVQELVERLVLAGPRDLLDLADDRLE
jgi:hypothetical protein